MHLSNYIFIITVLSLMYLYFLWQTCLLYNIVREGTGYASCACSVVGTQDLKTKNLERRVS